MAELFRFIYNLLFPFVFLLMLPRFAVRMARRGNYRHKFGQRLGMYSKRVRGRLAMGGRPVWVHAVSVGEVQVALRLLGEWRRLRPDLRVVLSTTTSTGFALASREAGDNVEVIYNPVDFPPVVAAAVRCIRPVMLVLVEAEVWPNVVARVKASGAPVALVNARLSPRSERRHLAFRRVVRGTLSQLDAVFLQDAEDLDVWARIGPPAECLHLVGGIKYDSLGVEVRSVNSQAARDILARLGVADDAPVVLGGSTHPGEEAALGRAFLALRREFPDAFLVAAPRHAERAAEAERDLAGLGLRVVRRSAAGGVTAVGVRPDVLLIDTTGELRGWYAAAAAAFIGKSLLAKGGQNPVEAIHAGVPVVCGPHMGNFRALMRSLDRADAVVRVGNELELAAGLARLLGDAGLRARLVAAANQALAGHDGATRRTVEVLDALM